MSTNDKTTKYIALMAKAKEAAKYSYSPYSNFPVGAAILTKDGRIISGCNVENATYNGGSCAEKTALLKAVSEGIKEFEAIAVFCQKSKNCWPCGHCRQFLSEFSIDMDVIVEDENKSINVASLKELFPYSFSSKQLAKSD